MARRVIATAEVQVAANTRQAEAGIEGIAESFQQLGQYAARAAAQTEAAFFGTATTVRGGFQQISAELEKVIAQMMRMDRGTVMAATFREAHTELTKLAKEQATLPYAARELHEVYKQAVGTLGAMDAELHQAGVSARVLADRQREAADATREQVMAANAAAHATFLAERHAAQLAKEHQRVADAAREAAAVAERSFRDVGGSIDLVMRGGRDGLENDIRETIRELELLGGEFRDVARIGEQALDGVMDNFDHDVEAALRALIRLEGQLRDIRSVGAGAMNELAADARRADAAITGVASAARKAERDLSGMATRSSGSVRGLVATLGAAGLVHEIREVARWGLDMTTQLENAEAMFLGLTGSVEGAADMLERMVVFARDTPYDLKNVTTAAAQLLAVGDGFGVTTENVEKYLTTFGQAITMTGGGNEQFERLVRVFGQMSSSGKVLGQDMNQLAQNLPGYDVWQTLADGAGKSVQELRQLQDLGKLDELLTGNEAVEILIEGMKNIPGAAGAMERRMNTLGGSIEKFKETAQLAVSEGMQPFAELAQDTLSDPIILRSVEKMAKAFGELASAGLEEVAPHFDYLAEEAADFLDAMKAWAPVLGKVVQGVGDVLSVLAPLVEMAGKATDAVLGLGGGLGKLAIAGVALAANGPIGIGISILAGVSGALDLFGQSNRDAAETARILAVAQGEVNRTMKEGEEVTYSNAQRIALEQAQDLADTYDLLAQRMVGWNVTVPELNAGLAQLAAGSEVTNAKVRGLFSEFDDFGAKHLPTAEQFEDYLAAWEAATEKQAEEAQKQVDNADLAGIAQIAAAERAAAGAAAYQEQMNGFRRAEMEASDRRVAHLERAADAVVELEEEQADALRGLLEEQVAAYEDWVSGIEDSINAAAVSMSGLAKDNDNNVRKMIGDLNAQSAATHQWKNNIVTAASQLVNNFGISDEAARDFMKTLGDMGPESNAAIEAMIKSTNDGERDLIDFYEAVQLNAGVMSTSMNDAFSEATGAVPSLEEAISSGNVTIEKLLAELPTYVEAAGHDMEAIADAIDMSDEMGKVGEDAVAGLVAALEAGLAAVSGASNRLAERIPRDVSRNLRIQSPSRVMMGIGEYAVEGLIVGFQNMSKEAEVTAITVATMMTGGIAAHFKGDKNAQESARKFAEGIAKSIIDELIAEQESVADAAEQLARAAADRLAEAWDRVKDRFRDRDIREAVDEAKADLLEARAELDAARALSGAEGKRAIAEAEQRVAAAKRLLEQAEALDAAADLAADVAVVELRRSQEDEKAEARRIAEAEVAAIQQRIAAANRNLDPVARAQAEAELVAARERHEAERLAMDRRHQDEQTAFKLRLSNENAIREETIKARKAEVNEMSKAFDQIVKDVAKAMTDMPKLIAAVTDAERGVEDAYMDQFERLMKNLTPEGVGAARDIGQRAGLSPAEVESLIAASLEARRAEAQAASAAGGVGNLLNILSSGLFTIGANGAVGIAAGITAEAAMIAQALIGSVQEAVNAGLAALKINSPSKVTRDLLGVPMGEGIAAGISTTIPEVGAAMAGLLDGVVSNTPIPRTSQLDASGASLSHESVRSAPILAMYDTVIQDATDADIVSQRLMVAIEATGVQL